VHVKKSSKKKIFLLVFNYEYEWTIISYIKKYLHMLPSSMVTDCWGVGSDRVRSDASVSNVVTTKSYSASFTIYV
jgi:hypothetical protein